MDQELYSAYSEPMTTVMLDGLAGSRRTQEAAGGRHGHGGHLESYDVISKIRLRQ